MAAEFHDGFLVPAGLTAFAWNSFTVKNGKIIAVAEESGFTAVERIVSKEADGWMVDIYTFTGPAGEGREKTESRSVTVSYDSNDRATNSFPVQPSKKALLQAVSESGKTTGSARVVDIIRIGRLKFRARVEIR